MKEYGHENLSELSVEMMHTYLHDMIIKSLVMERLDGKEARSDRTSEYEFEKLQLLKEYGLNCLSHTMTYRWMLLLGFRHETRRKGYYVDGHERKATIEYRWDFCEKYLSLEKKMFRWIQIPLEEAERLQALGKLTNGSGYKCTDELTGERMVEYHVDTCKDFMERKNKESEFGGDLSVRRDQSQRPLIVFGQDECIVKQYLFSKKSWSGPKGETALVPKDDGLGVMISAFVSREFGFGFELTNEQLQEVNAKRVGEKYKDETAAKNKHGTDLKQPLTTSPFYLEFEYGASFEGYWTYDSMVLQLEDCADVVKTLYQQYDFLFLFDHSCGHDCMPDDALKVDGMNKGYGGEQNKMKASIINSVDGYLGPHEHDRKLKVGDEQKMIFGPDDEGPYWMTPEEKEKTRKDQYGLATTQREYTKPQLIEMLKREGIMSPKGNRQQIRDMAQEAGLALTYLKREIIQGWEGKPKGMEQILWERGWIDPKVARKVYTVHGTKDSMGAVRKDTSLQYLMSNLKDFETQETMLCLKAREMGVMIDRTPKCHCELAGEGIEYAWGCAKNHYRRQPLKDKRGKDNFRRTVRKCFSRQVVTTERVRMFSQRARAYILAYHHIRQEQLTSSPTTDSDGTASPVNVEKLLKRFKMHRCAMDFDSSFCKAVFHSDDGKTISSTAASL
jgi:hypothetical protein